MNLMGVIRSRSLFVMLVAFTGVNCTPCLLFSQRILHNEAPRAQNNFLKRLTQFSTPIGVNQRVYERVTYNKD